VWTRQNVVFLKKREAEALPLVKEETELQLNGTEPSKEKILPATHWQTKNKQTQRIQWLCAIWIYWVFIKIDF
jgi:hypothetical protein